MLEGRQRELIAPEEEIVLTGEKDNGTGGRTRKGTSRRTKEGQDGVRGRHEEV